MAYQSEINCCYIKIQGSASSDAITLVAVKSYFVLICKKNITGNNWRLFCFTINQISYITDTDMIYPAC